jgi:hypothetical protein
MIKMESWISFMHHQDSNHTTFTLILANKKTAYKNNEQADNPFSRQPCQHLYC